MPNQIHDFTRLLLDALSYTRLILATHWDNFERPYAEGPHDLRDVLGDSGNLDVSVKDVMRPAPKTETGRSYGAWKMTSQPTTAGRPAKE